VTIGSLLFGGYDRGDQFLVVQCVRFELCDGVYFLC